MSTPAMQSEMAVSIPVVRDDVRVGSATSVVEPRSRSNRACRLMNIVVASTALVLASPIMLLFAALIKLTSPGPIFYSQARVGIDRRRARVSNNRYDRRTRDLGGNPFIIWKFRSMHVNAERESGAIWATAGDPRMTAVGRVMRKCRIDELPQLFNVIRGDMNIVGPRPERPAIFSRLCRDIEEYPLRQRAKPGITGWAQVNQTYDVTVEDVRNKVRYDLEYLKRQGVREDLKIMARTVPIVVLGRGW